MDQVLRSEGKGGYGFSINTQISIPLSYCLFSDFYTYMYFQTFETYKSRRITEICDRENKWIKVSLQPNLAGTISRQPSTPFKKKSLFGRWKDRRTISHHFSMDLTIHSVHSSERLFILFWNEEFIYEHSLYSWFLSIQDSVYVILQIDQNI